MQQFKSYPQSLKQRYNINWKMFLFAVIEDAWNGQVEKAKENLQSQACQITLRDRLGQRYPKEDMAVLAKYGMTEEISAVSVRVFDEDTSRWDRSVTVQLGGTVTVPNSFARIYMRPSWWNDPMCGCTPEFWGKLTELGRQEQRERRDKDAADWLPLQLEDHVKALLSVYKVYEADKLLIEETIARVRHQTGYYPTWQDLVDLSPTVGPVLATYIGKKAA